MNINELWTVEQGSTVKLLNGNFGKVLRIDIQNQSLHIEQYNDDFSVGVLQIHCKNLKSLTKNPYLLPKRQALLEID